MTSNLCLVLATFAVGAPGDPGCACKQAASGPVLQSVSYPASGPVRTWFRGTFGHRPQARVYHPGQPVRVSSAEPPLAIQQATPRQTTHTSFRPSYNTYAQQGVSQRYNQYAQQQGEVHQIPQQPDVQHVETRYAEPQYAQPQYGQPQQAVAQSEPESLNHLQVAKEYETKIGHEADYSWVTGQLMYVHTDGGRWVIRYTLPDEVDKFGGSVVLAPGVEMKNFREGDLVCVYGEVLNDGRATRLGGPLYRVNAISMVERSDP